MKIDKFLLGKKQHFEMPNKDNDIAISVKTEAEYRCVCIYLSMIGFIWSSEQSFDAKMDFFYTYKENTYIFPLSGKYGSSLPKGMHVYTYDQILSQEEIKIRKIKLLDIL